MNALKGSTLVSRNSQQRCASASLCRSKRSSANSFDMYRPSTANVLTRYRPSQVRIHGQIGVSRKIFTVRLKISIRPGPWNCERPNEPRLRKNVHLAFVLPSSKPVTEQSIVSSLQHQWNSLCHKPLKN